VQVATTCCSSGGNTSHNDNGSGSGITNGTFQAANATVAVSPT
jgi:hypothetical protein